MDSWVVGRLATTSSIVGNCCSGGSSSKKGFISAFW